MPIQLLFESLMLSFIVIHYHPDLWWSDCCHLGEEQLFVSGQKSYSLWRCFEGIGNLKILKTLSGPRNEHCQGNRVRPNYSSTGHLFISFVTQTFVTHCVFFKDLIGQCVITWESSP